MQTNPLKLHAAIVASFLLHGLGLPSQATTPQIMNFPAGVETICGLNVVNPQLYAGTLVTVTVPSGWNGSWKFTTSTKGMVFTLGRFYTIEFVDGQWAIIVVGGSGGNTVRTTAMFRPGPGVTPLTTPLPVATNSFVIREVMTVAQVFGETAPLLNSGSMAATADTIEMPDGDKIFYDGCTWRRNRGTSQYKNQGGFPIYFVQGFIFRRLPGIPLSISVNGVVKTTQTWMKLHSSLVKRPSSSIPPNSSLVSTITSTTRAGGLLTLGGSGLYLGNAPLAGLRSSVDGDFATAETVLIQNLTSSYEQYLFFDDTMGNMGWFDSSFNPTDSAPLPCAVYLAPKRTMVFIRWNP